MKYIPFVEKRVDARLISLQTLNKVGVEAVHAIGENAHAVEQVGDHDRLENVEFKLAVHTTDGGSDVVTHDLGADHSEGLALGGVDLARHNRRSRLILGEAELTKTAAGAGAEVADVLGDLEQRAGQGVQRSGSLDDGVVGSENFKLVGGRS